jgi:hypothetical protein
MITPQTKGGDSLSLGFMYSESLALGVLLFAQASPSFKQSLSEYVYPKNTPLKAPTIPRILPLLVPEDEHVAKKRVTWVLQNGSEEAQLILQEAVKDRPFDEPKAVVLGITIGALPIGVLGHDKPGKKVTVISHTTETNVESLIENGVRSSLTLLERVVHDARGDLRKVDPDMTDWFFGEKKLEFYKASRETIAELERELSSLDIPHATLSDEHGPVSIAVSPAINPETLTLDWDLEGIAA